MKGAAITLALGAALASAAQALAQRPSERSPGMPVVNDAAWWTGSYRPRDAEFTQIERTARYVTMPDGVRLAVDVYLPQGLPAGRRLPVILEQTRYYRSSVAPGGGCSKSTRAQWFAARGYGYVIVDVRGTGASFGSRSSEFNQQEVRDGAGVVDWIVGQPWSDGKVGATGVSYVGTTAELLLRNNHPAVKAVAPQFAGYDFYSEVNYPGGIRNNRFITAWGMGNRLLDAGSAPQLAAGGGLPCPVDGPDGAALRTAAIAEHRANINSADAQAQLVFRDDAGANGITIGDRSVYSQRPLIDRGKVPVYVIESWTDMAYQAGGVHRLLNTTNPNMRLLIGAWNHGGNFYYAPGVTRRTRPAFWVDEELLRFFDAKLKGIDTGFDREPRVRYFTTGIDQWRSAPAWPPRGFRATRWCFAERGALDRGCRAPSGSDRYVVRDDATAGNETRWDTGLRGPVVYPDRRDQAARTLTYTSAPLATATEITGQPVVRMTMTTSAPDGNFIAYLEEVRPDGSVHYVNEAVLRLSHSRAGRAPYRTHGPAHSHLRRDWLGDVSGRTLSFQVTMFPMSHVFAAGSSIRVSIAGADGDRFSGGTPGATWTVVRGGARLSGIDLPIARGR